MAEFEATIALSTLDGTTGFRLDGEGEFDRSGWSVASAGDINGDGFDDIIVGAYGADLNGYNSGSSYVVFGRAGGFAPILDLWQLDGADGFRLDGVAGSWSGFSVASAGDVNGDGFDDIIVGAYRAEPNGSVSGSSYVVFGRAGGVAPTLDLSTLDGTDGFRLDGADEHHYSGRSVASAGDVNGDGFDDVIVGAVGADASYVVFGQASGFADSLDLGALDGSDGFRLEGEGNSGFSVASAGDINGDGVDDLIIGAHYAGAAGKASAGFSYVVFGQSGGFAATLDLGALDGSDGFRLDGVAAYDKSGFSVASAGDVNGDGFDDLIIGAFTAGPNGESAAGSSYVVFGQTADFPAIFDLSVLNGTNGFRIDGAAEGDRSGWSVASAGDVNGDGFDDLLIGALNADPNGNTDAGSSYVVFGKAGGFDPSIDLSALDGTNGFRLDGAAESDNSGRSVASAGDVNGDGFDDLIIGADQADPNGTDRAGSSYVVFGRAPDAAVTRVGAAADQKIMGGAFGDTLSGLGGADDLRGGAGDDTLIGGIGADLLDGGSGTDKASYRNAATGVVAGLAKAASNTGEAAGDSYAGIENLEGSDFADELTGNAGANVLIGGEGDDRLSGGSGNDRLYGGSGNDTVGGGGGNDVLAGGSGNDVVRGGPGNDRLFGGSGNDRLLAGGGNDQLRGGAGDDKLRGGGGDDVVIGGGGNDDLRGHGDDDALRGGAGEDRLFGGSGNDILRGGGDNDVLRGASGNDVLLGNRGDDRLAGGNDEDFLHGGSGNDVLIGGGGNDRLTGGGRHDVLLGNGGDDRLTGGAGNDKLVGGAGNDRLVGDGGADRFVFQPNGGDDLLADFEDGLDLLNFRAFDFADAASVLDLATQTGVDVVFALPGGATIEVNNFDIDLLGAEDLLI